MSKKNTLDITKPDVAGALSVVRSKKSREQIKIERLKPFVPVINEALKSGWKWSPIVVLIRQRGGPSLSKKEAENLYEQIKDQCVSDDNAKAGEGVPPSVNSPLHRLPFGPKKEVVA
ncbi:hypothetical protein [Burkholderia pseudomallei]|uniref:hypothetical protein n=1 Tax=Burkholderia pseudomallei TaxID=28450 RepID=UPI00015F7E9F|nr:hypothetical protein [Burkholderia pseudomallei]AIP59859.1 hypothetical protein DR54_3174 [Burkholderia pseudomallei HBPUB10303a]AJX61205.1 hypothetical protein DP47_689 [Burkholderia pseudomallei Pasteur 52237]EDO89793.1 hypothetical protein BURPSPAST_Y0133 [Burkholderia pseudomallei Pasteur 52237]CAJ3330213.1 Uncharacterised protein [Burkholderia pseudomallei]CAJ6747594.1 Uncharacterised protein [Burkholderia pseudomallei]